MRKLFLVISICSAAMALTHCGRSHGHSSKINHVTDHDPATYLPLGTQVSLRSDLNLRPTTTSETLGTKVDTDYFQNESRQKSFDCMLTYEPSSVDREIKKSVEFTTSSSMTLNSEIRYTTHLRTKNGFTATLDCGAIVTVVTWSDDYKENKPRQLIGNVNIGELKKLLVLTLPAPIQID